MKSNITLSILFSLGLFLSACNKGAESLKREGTPPITVASPTPPQEYKQEYKGMVITVRDIERLDKYEVAGESATPSKPGNNFALIVLRVQPSKDNTMKWEAPDDAFIFSTTEGQVSLKQPYLAYDIQGNKYRGLSLATSRIGDSSKEFILEFLFELPKTVQLKTLQFDDLPLDLEKGTRK